MKFSGNFNRFLINLFNSGKVIRLLISLDSTTRSSIPTSSFSFFPNIIKSSISLSFRLMLSMKLCGNSVETPILLTALIIASSIILVALNTVDLVGLRVNDLIVVKENTAVFPVGSSLSGPVLGVVTIGSSFLSSNLFGCPECGGLRLKICWFHCCNSIDFITGSLEFSNVSLFLNCPTSLGINGDECVIGGFFVVVVVVVVVVDDVDVVDVRLEVVVAAANQVVTLTFWIVVVLIIVAVLGIIQVH
uniref:Transmembrane protein n=1 Tax=Glossina palpalis gambiensis TaxID=67801 RepID=A0A1B0ATE9_9MUSC